MLQSRDSACSVIGMDDVRLNRNHVYSFQAQTQLHTVHIVMFYYDFIFAETVYFQKCMEKQTKMLTCDQTKAPISSSSGFRETWKMKHTTNMNACCESEVY